jgi:hypothetical protein
MFKAEFISSNFPEQDKVVLKVCPLFRTGDIWRKFSLFVFKIDADYKTRLDFHVWTRSTLSQFSQTLAKAAAPFLWVLLLLGVARFA